MLLFPIHCLLEERHHIVDSSSCRCRGEGSCLKLMLDILVDRAPLNSCSIIPSLREQCAGC